VTRRGIESRNERFMAWPAGSKKPPRRGGPGLSVGGRGLAVGAALVGVAVLVVAAGLLFFGGGSGPGPTGSAGGSSSPSAGASASPGQTAAATQTAGAVSVPLAVVGAFDAYKVNSATLKSLKARLEAGTLILPCGAEAAVAGALGSDGSGAAPCVAVDQITAALDPGSTDLALIPPALVTPRVKVIPLESADLFGQASARAKDYPLAIAAPGDWSPAWTIWIPANVRVVVTTGVNCPDRGVSYQTVVQGKGWDWLAEGGTARIAGTHFNSRYDHTVLDPVRTGNAGAVKALIKGAEVALSDFECPMTKNFKQHNSGTGFSIDPRVATLMGDFGFDVATIATDHMSNAGLGAIRETVAFFNAAGVQPTGGGKNLDEALKPAIVDAGGLVFGFIGLDAIGGSPSATPTKTGVAALTDANVKAAVARAKAAGAKVIIGLVQWSSVEYRAKFTDFQLAAIKQLYRLGIDHIVGDDFHWAGAIQLTLADSTYHYAGASQGNFWFDQDWSRETEEAVITSLTFVGTRLVQVRLTPTVVVDNGQVNLMDPATDGQVVLKRVLAASTLPGK
jgi:poly-gamma-glutamate capsule biosynthesis protein CapA/YwtB (metallophosphatase superfamily)